MFELEESSERTFSSTYFNLTKYLIKKTVFKSIIYLRQTSNSSLSPLMSNNLNLDR